METSTCFFKLLECPICFEFFTSPIFLCLGGHTFCNSCRSKITSCAICRSPLTNIRCHTLEQVTEHLLYPCKNDGCNHVCHLKEMKKHRENCVFHNYTCPVNSNCTWSGIYSLLLEHLRKEHVQDLISEEHVFKWSKNKKYKQNFISQSNDYFFRVKIEQEDKFFKIKVEIIGPQEEAKNFKYEFRFTDANTTESVMFVKQCKTVEESEHFSLSINVFENLGIYQIDKIYFKIFKK